MLSEIGLENASADIFKSTPVTHLQLHLPPSKSLDLSDFALFRSVMMLPIIAYIKFCLERLMTKNSCIRHRKAYCNSPWFKMLHVTIWHSRNVVLVGIKSCVSRETQRVDTNLAHGSFFS